MAITTGQKYYVLRFNKKYMHNCKKGQYLDWFVVKPGDEYEYAQWDFRGVFNRNDAKKFQSIQDIMDFCDGHFFAHDCVDLIKVTEQITITSRIYNKKWPLEIS